MFRRTYARFKQAGVSSTLEGRLHLLAANAVNVLVFIFYWSLFAVPYLLTYQVDLEYQDRILTTVLISHVQFLASILRSLFSSILCPKVSAGMSVRRMGYYFISFHVPCKGFYDLVVFVITNDLSYSALKAADEGSSDEPGGGAQSNKALRDEVRESMP